MQPSSSSGITRKTSGTLPLFQSAKSSATSSSVRAPVHDDDDGYDFDDGYENVTPQISAKKAAVVAEADDPYDFDDGYDVSADKKQLEEVERRIAEMESKDRSGSLRSVEKTYAFSSAADNRTQPKEDDDLAVNIEEDEEEIEEELSHGGESVASEDIDALDMSAGAADNGGGFDSFLEDDDDDQHDHGKGKSNFFGVSKSSNPGEKVLTAKRSASGHSQSSSSLSTSNSIEFSVQENEASGSHALDSYDYTTNALPPTRGSRRTGW